MLPNFNFANNRENRDILNGAQRMLDRFLNRLTGWSPLRFWTYAVLATFVAMETVSWITSRVPPCVVNPGNYSTYYGDEECPTQHVFLIVTVSGILETIGHN